MTSRDGKTRGRGVFFWLPLSLLIVALLFIAGWFAAAHLAQTRSRMIVAQLNAAGKTIDCRNASITGFPINFDVSCKAIGYKDEKGGFSLTSGPTKVAMPLYDPFRMTMLLHGPALIDTPDVVPLALDWEKLNAYLSLSMSSVTGIMIEGESVEMKNASSPADLPALLKLGGAQITIEPSGGDLDLAVSLADISFGAALPDLHGLPPISGTGNVRLFSGADVLQTGLQSLRNRQFAINRLELDPGPDSSAAVSGNISFDSEGLADGTLRVTLHNLKALSTSLVKAFPQEAQKIQPAFAMLGTLGNDQALPVEIRKGKITLGFFKIGRLPPVD